MSQLKLRICIAHHLNMLNKGGPAAFCLSGKQGPNQFGDPCASGFRIIIKNNNQPNNYLAAGIRGHFYEFFPRIQLFRMMYGTR